MHAPETASASSTWLRCYGTESYECSYWPERQARSQVVQSGQELLGNAYSQLIRLGFRRSGLHIYRPHCDHCQACTPLRVDALHFQPSRSQKRAWKRHAHLRARVLTPTWSEESYALYQRYQASRHPGGGMDDGDQEQYAQFLLASRVETRLVEFRDPADDRLVMVSVIDLLDDGLSAVYTYYDPDTPGSLGAYSILWQIAQCQENRRPWLYLGYWIPGHGKMHYKASYTPAQILFEGHWLPFDELPPQHWPGLLATPRQKP